MCGIIGYIGPKARNIVIDGLYKLEYRGYDSAGIAEYNPNTKSYEIFKETGRVKDLKKTIKDNYETTLAIGHTRWATHGEVNKVNSHPHISSNKRFIIVHNGIIENYKRIKYEYLKNYSFYSKTDSEVIVNLIEYFSSTYSVIDSIRKAMTILEGTYAFLIIDALDNETIYFAKKQSPLLIGLDDKGAILSSDLLSFVGVCDNYYSISDNTLGYIKGKELKLLDLLGNDIKPKFKKINIKEEDINKGSFNHYMLKEIYETPYVIRNLISKYFDNDDIVLQDELVKVLKESSKIYIVASGTSYNAGLIGKYYFEKFGHKEVSIHFASELMYDDIYIKPGSIFLMLSQSGETLDSINVINRYKGLFKIISITNQEESSLNRLSDFSLNLYAGREIAVASTKTYISEIIVSLILAMSICDNNKELKHELSNLAVAVDKVLLKAPICSEIAKEIYNSPYLFYIGRGLDYYVALEASLKLKEVSYVFSQAYPSGELKHGPIALIDDKTPVIALITSEATNAITRVNLKEAKTRNAKTIVVSTETFAHDNDVLVLPNVVGYLSPVTLAIAVQLIAYYTAKEKNCDIDKPKNLAKCVTVA